MNKHLSEHLYLITNPVEVHGTRKKKIDMTKFDYPYAFSWETALT